ncbi:unnamed protein product [Adineta steineri]|uniref:Uncharacterized protein n=1 Tax=Adineta steineri TaxID=433720 RepID=A0A813PVV5_9BILA|nr:unnamed protein product [Adineta steineri]CAF0796503.1 unnamed protein product [Adineta steineri]
MGGVQHPHNVTRTVSGGLYYLVIVDQNTNRFIGSSPYGYRCLVGCSQQAGSTSSQLNQPYSMSFDNQENIYIKDKNNARVQMFNLIQIQIPAISFMNIIFIIYILHKILS